MNLNLTKTTINFAKSRNMDFSEWTDENHPDDIKIAVYINNEDCEPDFVITQKDDQFFLRSNIYLSRDVWEELPYWIKSEKHLRQVLDFIYNSRGQL